MGAGQLGPLVHYLRRVAGKEARGELADGPLLERFLELRDEQAFETLVRRHGSMVLGVCLHVLRDRHAAEDAFQATFLILLRKARSIREPEHLGNWLYGTAYFTARNMRTSTQRRRAREDRLRARTRCERVSPARDSDDLQPILEEINLLPAPYRVVVVLCYLEQRSRKEVARQLGLAEGTVSSRLNRARAVLHQRLAARGLTLSAAALSGVLSEGVASACVPLHLITCTVHGATLLQSGPELLSSHLQGLLNKLLKCTATTQLRAVLGAGLVLGLLAAGAGSAARQIPAADKGEQPAAAGNRPAISLTEPVHVDRQGDPLPEGALARLGTTRLRHPDGLRGVAFSTDGKVLVSSDRGGTVRLWEVPSGKLLHELAPPQTLSCVAFAPSPDARWLAGCGPEGVFLWKVGNPCPVLTLKPFHEPDGAQCISFSADGHTFAVANSRSARLWDAVSGRELGRLEPQSGESGPSVISTVALSPDGRYLASSGYEHPLRVRDFRTGTERLRLTAAACPQPASFSFSADGKYLAAVMRDSIEVWEVGTGTLMRRIGPLEPWPVAVAFAPDGATLASGNWQNGRILVWDLRTGKQVRRLEGHADGVAALAFSSDGRWIASGSRDQTVRVWDVATGTDICPLMNGPQGEVHALAYSRDGRRLASADSRTLRLWDPTSGREVWHAEVARQAWLWCLAFSPDGAMLACGEGLDVITHGKEKDTFQVCLWDVARGRQRRQWDVPRGDMVSCLAFSPTGAVLATATRPAIEGLPSHLLGPPVGRQVILWKVTSGQEVRRFSFPGEDVERVAFSPDGDLFAAQGNNTTLVWSTRSGNLLHSISLADQGQGLLPAGILAANASLDFTPDQRALAIGITHYRIDPFPRERGWEMRVWDLSTWASAPCFQVTGAGMDVLRYTDDGTSAVLGCSDGTVRLWDALSGQEWASFRAHRQALAAPCRRPRSVSALSISPDGRTATTGGRDGDLLVWDLTGEWAASAASGKYLAAAQMQACWRDLGSLDAVRAQRACWRLSAAPGLSVPFLAAQLRKETMPDAERFRRLLKELDSDQYAVREQAERMLESFGELARPTLQQALAAGPAPEVRRRLTSLMSHLKDPNHPPTATLRVLRAAAVLERASTPQARDVLRSLARDGPGERVRRQAEAALLRLERRCGNR